MHLTYNKLWKLLIDKGMNKSDLAEITGLSSRTMAKLSKNQSVTTDTLLSICSALRCDVSDIMQMVDDDPGASLYEAYLSADVTEVDEFFRITRFEHKGKRIAVYKTLERANRNTTVECGEYSVKWRQGYPNNRPGAQFFNCIESVIFNLNRHNRDEMAVIVISGKAYDIRGLDEFAFISSRRRPSREDYVYLMSEAIFKLFEPVHEWEK